MTSEGIVHAMAECIARQEGWSKPKSRARMNNNPGNLRTWGKRPTRNGYACFVTAEDGWRALREQCHKNLFERNLSIFEFFAGKRNIYAGYAPASDGNSPTLYARNVATWLTEKFGYPVSTDTVLATLEDDTCEDDENSSYRLP